MNKTYCDGCGEEITNTYGRNRLELAVHLFKDPNDLNGHIDGNGNRISGRGVHKDLCAKCYNEVGEIAVAKLREIQKRYNSDNTLPRSISELKKLVGNMSSVAQNEHEKQIVREFAHLIDVNFKK